jgi:hypothetical protein
LHGSVGFVPARFLTREQVSDELNSSMPKAYALLRRRELRATKIGGRGDYGIGRDDLDAGIEGTYAQTKGIDEHPCVDVGSGSDSGEPAIS